MNSRTSHSWDFLAAPPAREVFAAMEQLIGTRPYRFEVLDANAARAVENERRGFFGQWKTPRRRMSWVSCSALEEDQGTAVAVRSTRDRAAVSRAVQLVRLLTRGGGDSRTVYRDRRIPPGPVTLVASWAGMPYRLFAEPSFTAHRGAAVHTATPLWAVRGAVGSFVKVRLMDGTEGYVERDEVVAAPARATRQAQADAARFV
ncbi:MAG: hypothetical protein ABR564_04175 [Candidatus Dormibacteria bacterium]